MAESSEGTMGNPSPENDNAHLEPLENNIVHLLNTNPPAENASEQDPGILPFN